MSKPRQVLVSLAMAASCVGVFFALDALGVMNSVSTRQSRSVSENFLAELKYVMMWIP